MIISFEGIDASGKETQCKLLAEKLEAKGLKVKIITFPDYETPLGSAIKKFLADGYKVDDKTAAMLYAADRRQHCEMMQGLLGQGYILLTDRYKYSNFAFFSNRGVEMGWLVQLDSTIPESDLVILLDLTPEESISRKDDQDKFEGDGEYLAKVRETYLKLAAENQWTVIDGSLPVEQIHSKALEAVEEVLK